MLIWYHKIQAIHVNIVYAAFCFVLHDDPWELLSLRRVCLLPTFWYMRPACFLRDLNSKTMSYLPNTLVCIWRTAYIYHGNHQLFYRAWRIPSKFLISQHMMTSSNENFFRVTGHFCGKPSVSGEFHHKGQWCGALIISLICAWTNGWVNNADADDLRRHRAHYDVTVMKKLVHRHMLRMFANINYCALMTVIFELSRIIWKTFIVYLKIGCFIVNGSNTICQSDNLNCILWLQLRQREVTWFTYVVTLC